MRTANYSRPGYPMFHPGDVVRNSATGELGTVLSFHEAPLPAHAYVSVKIDRFTNRVGWQTIYQNWGVSHVSKARLR